MRGRTTGTTQRPRRAVPNRWRRTITTICALGLLAETAAAGALLAGNRHTGDCLPDIGIATGSTLVEAGPQARNARLDRIAALGVHRIRVDIPWSELQPREPTASDDGVDATTAHVVDDTLAAAGARGIEVLGILDFSPGWARTHPGSAFPGATLPDDPAAMAEFTRGAVRRWGQGITAWEIWNEPNLVQFSDPVDPQRYAALVRATAAAIHDVAPGTPVAAGALANAGDSGGNSPPDRFADAMFAAGLGPDVTAISVHPYSIPHPPRIEVWDAVSPRPRGFGMLARIHHLATDHGVDLPFWVTEFGTPTGRFHFAGAVSEVSPEKQAEALRTAVRLAAGTGYVERFYVYTDSDLPGTGQVQDGVDDAEAHFGLLEADGTPKPAAQALREVNCHP